MASIIDRLKGLFPRPVQVHLNPEYQEAYHFKDAFQPQNGVDYKWVDEYARLVYDRFDHADQVLDGKAESLIRVLGGGTGLLTLGAIANIAKLNAAVVSLLAVALLLTLLSVCCAAWARLPREVYLPPSIAWALSYADVYKEKSASWFLAQWHLTCEGLRLTILAKSQYVKLATWLAVASFAVIAISFVVAAATIDASAAR